VQQVTTNTSNQMLPWISGDNIVYEDYRNGRRVYLWNPANGERQVSMRDSGWPVIFGDKIVYEVVAGNNNIDVYMYDLVSEKEWPICTNPANQFYPVISGDRIVWQDNRNGNWDIYGWDPNNGERQITNNPADQWSPFISGDRVVWRDTRDGGSKIYMSDPINGEQRVTPFDDNRQYQPVICGDYIVWGEYVNGSSDIYMWDPNNGKRAVCTDPLNQDAPFISGNKIVWEQYAGGRWDFFMADIPVPEPMTTGIIGLGTLGLLTRYNQKETRKQR
jgi:TolB protein